MAVSVTISAVATGQTTATITWGISGVTVGIQPWTVTLSGGGTITPAVIGPNSNGGQTGQTAYVTGLTASTTYTFHIDSETNGAPGPSANASPITTSAPVSAPVWSDQTLGSFQTSVAYSDGVSATNSPTYAVYSGSLPTGISLNTSTGAVTGTPTVSGQSYSFVLSASNAGGTIYTSTFSGTVAAAPTAGKIKVWNGSAWVYGTMKVWNGSAWVTGTVKVYNGSTWTTSV